LRELHERIVVAVGRIVQLCGYGVLRLSQEAGQAGGTVLRRRAHDHSLLHRQRVCAGGALSGAAGVAVFLQGLKVGTGLPT